MNYNSKKIKIKFLLSALVLLNVLAFISLFNRQEQTPTSVGFILNTASDPNAFLSVWDTTQPGSSSNQVNLPLESGGLYNFFVQWGDGKNDTITSYTQGTHIYAIITARLEKYRPWTEDWLRQHGITYDNLVMGPWVDKEERAKFCLGTYKADHCERLGIGMFVESCPVQSQIIKARRYQPVLCPALGGSIAK